MILKGPSVGNISYIDRPLTGVFIPFSLIYGVLELEILS